MTTTPAPVDLGARPTVDSLDRTDGGVTVYAETPERQTVAVRFVDVDHAREFLREALDRLDDDARQLGVAVEWTCRPVTATTFGAVDLGDRLLVDDAGPYDDELTVDALGITYRPATHQAERDRMVRWVEVSGLLAGTGERLDLSRRADLPCTIVERSPLTFSD